MSFELFVALRYLKAKRKGLFAVVTTAIGVTGVTLGVAALITTLSVMNGFQADIQKKVIGAQAHLTIYGVRSPESLASVNKVLHGDPEVVATAPFVLGQAILTHRERTMGVVLKGLDPEQEFAVNDLGKSLTEGDWRGLESDKKTPGIVLGQELAANVGAMIGSEVVLVSPKSVATPLGLLPKMQKFHVAGLLHTGYYEYDATTAWTSLGAASQFFGVEAATAVGAKIRDLNKAEAVARRLQDAFGLAHVVRTFNQMNRTLFAALRLEKGVMFIILTLIVLVASLNIASTLILLGVEKTRDIGLFKSMGASPKQIRRIFFIEGLLIGGAGVIMGTGLGFLLCFIIQRYPIVELPSDIYYLSRVPVSIQWQDVAVITGVGLLLSVLATLYPSTRAAKVNPVEAIHYG